MQNHCHLYGESVSQILLHIHIVQSDQGKNFQSKLFKRVHWTLNFQHNVWALTTQKPKVCWRGDFKRSNPRCENTVLKVEKVGIRCPDCIVCSPWNLSGIPWLQALFSATRPMAHWNPSKKISVDYSSHETNMLFYTVTWFKVAI